MRKITLLIICLACGVLLGACAVASPSANSSSPVVSVSSDSQTNTNEALQWLESNNNPSAFASNRFGDTENAIAFVRSLYDCGAIDVQISGIYDEPSRIEEEGGPYADTLIVKLPADQTLREDIMAFYQAECVIYFCNEGDEEAGIQNDTLTLWWD